MVGSRSVASLIAVCLVLLASSCKEDKTHAPYPGPGGSGTEQKKEGVIPSSTTLNLTPISKLNQGSSAVNSHKGQTSRSHICRDFRSNNPIPESLTGGKAIYPRITRSKDGLYLMTYHLGSESSNAGNQISMLTSLDLEHWTYKGLINGYESITDDFGYSNKRAFAGANLLTLANGDILYSVSFRALHGYGGHTYGDNYNSSGILVRRSTDGGISWDEGTVIFTGMNWETHMVQLPSGDIHCFFTNSSVRLNIAEWPQINNNAGVGCVVSHDNGYTWTYVGDVVRQVRDKISTTTLFTDQMPVVVALNETGELAGAFESQMAKAVYTATDYWISLAYSGGDKEYPVLRSDQVGPVDRVSSFCKGASPFIIQFPSGETVLSYNENNYFYTRLGDENGRNFGSQSKSLDKKGYWGSMYVDTPHSMLASVGGNSTHELDFAVFYLNHNIRASSRTVSVDGAASEWSNSDDALFLGAKSQAQATLRCSSDGSKVYFLVEVRDNNLNSSDYITLYLSSPEDKSLGASSIKLQLSLAGLKSSCIWDKTWKETELGIEAVSALDGTVGNSKDEDNGYLVEVAVPKTSLPGLKDGKLIVDFTLFDMSGGSESVAGENVLSEWPVIMNL